MSSLGYYITSVLVTYIDRLLLLVYSVSSGVENKYLQNFGEKILWKTPNYNINKTGEKR
jgi:hypothetical protein